MLGNRCLDHTEKPPSRPTDYVIRHILRVSRPNSNVRSEWRKSTRIIDRISQRSNRQDQSAEAEGAERQQRSMMLRQAHSISWSVLEGTFCGSEALYVTEKVALARWDVSWPSAMKRKC
eukprot:COSAG02_NODE_4055_length_5840_cov_3.261656_6_plen_119_part_00